MVHSTHGNLGSGLDCHRRLVKSLSEAANTENTDHNSASFNRSSLRAGQDTKIQRIPSFDMAEEDYSVSPCEGKIHSESSDVFLDESPAKLKKGQLQKTLSEGEILQDKKKAMVMASGYVDVDINGYHGSEEDLIESQCVDECSIDLSHSRIFSQESLIEEPEIEEELFNDQILPEDDIPIKLAVKAVPPEFRDRISPSTKLCDETRDQFRLDMSDGTTAIGEDSPDISPVDVPSIQDTIDACEESVSESQVTVIPLRKGIGSSGHLAASDSENGGRLAHHESHHKNLYVKQGSLHGSSFEEDEEPTKSRLSVARSSTTNLSSISDEAASASDTVVTDSSHGRVSPSSTSSEYDRAIASSTEEYSSVISGDSMTVKSDGFDHDFDDQDLVIEENYMERLVQELKGSSKFSPSKLHTKNIEPRKVISPESDSSSSHFTEQETTSRATNTRNSKSDLSRTDSHPITDPSPSETSDDYVTANDSDIDNRKSLILEERHVSSPPSMEDIMEDEITPKLFSPAVHKKYREGSEATEILNSDFETALDMTTSPVSDTTTSASYQIEYGDEFDKFSECKDKPELPPKPGGAVPRPMIPPKPERFSVARESKERPLKLDANKALNTGSVSDNNVIQSCDKLFNMTSTKISQINGGSDPDQSSNDESKRFSRYFDAESNTTEDSADNQGDGEDSDSENQKDLWSEEEREKIKLGMKLDFPPGTSMYGDSNVNMNKKNKEEVIKKLKIYEAKPKKSVKIDLNRMPSRSRSQSPKEVSISQSPTDKRKDKCKSKSPEEASTPGMVRSPAMHEGFRLQDWTPVRTPGTPDKVIDLDTSDDSGTDHSPRIPKARSPNRPVKDHRKKTKENFKKGEDILSLGKTAADIRNSSWSSKEKIEISESPNLWHGNQNVGNHPTYRRFSLMQESTLSHELDTGFVAPHPDKSECHLTICTQCGERPASREGVLRSTPSPQQMIPVAQPTHTQQHFAHQMYVMQKSPSLQHNYHPEMSMSLPRPRPIPLRARSEERSGLGREW